jgi:hypothetical protein
LRFADRIETGVPGRLAFDSVPANLRDRPTLSVLLEAGGGKQSVELSYLTGGLAWKADYVANLSADGKSLDLNGWVTLTNRSGAGFDDATLQLVAGTVNRVRQPRTAPMPWRPRRGARQGGGGDAGSADGLPPLQLRAADFDRRQPDQAARPALRWRRAGAPRIPAGRQRVLLPRHATARSARN